MKNAFRGLAVSALLALGLAPPAPADEVTIQGDRDNTLFEDASGSLSNGAGPVLFAGNNGQDLARRALLRFDLAGAVPPGRRIEQVTLTLNVSNASNTTPYAFTLHRLLDPWGEGTSSTTSGSGAPATDGDATWIHRFAPDQAWAAVGGDYQSAPSATQEVGGVGRYSWTAPEMTIDVQSWIDDLTSNHGWLVMSDENTLNTARRFDSRENAVAANRPVLTIRYSSSVSVAEDGASSGIRLGPCTPNPSIRRTTVRFDLPRRAQARLAVFDFAGRRVATLVDGWIEAGTHVVDWSGDDGWGGRVSPGVYFYQLSVDHQVTGVARVVRLR